MTSIEEWRDILLILYEIIFEEKLNFQSFQAILIKQPLFLEAFFDLNYLLQKNYSKELSSLIAGQIKYFANSTRSSYSNCYFLSNV